MRVKSVLMFGWELAPLMSGGLGVVCKDLTDALIKQGINVTFVLPKVLNNQFDSKATIINASDHIPQELLLNPYISLYHTKDDELYSRNLINEVKAFASISRKICKNASYDIIHAHDWMTGLAGIEAKKYLNKPLVFHVHSTEYDRTANNPHPLILEYEQKALDNADRIIAISEYTKNILMEKYHIDGNKISVVHNSIDFDSNELESLKEKEKKREKMVLFLARLTVQKGADYLLRAIKKILTKRRNVKFVFVGNGPMLPQLIDMSFELNINQNVIFTNAIDHSQVDEAYRQADLFVMPSVSEPFGITCLEAIKNGTPVLISKQSGASEVIQNALKVDFWDIDEIASKILSVLDNDNLASTLTNEGIRDLKRLTWDNQVAKVIQIYHELV